MLRRLAAGAGAAAAVASAVLMAGPAHADTSAGVPQVGRIAVGTCSIDGAVIDPGLAVMVLLRGVVPQCAPVTLAQSHVELEAYSTRTLRLVASAPIDALAVNAGAPLHLGRLPLDPVRHRVFVAWGNGQQLQAYSLRDLLAGVKLLEAAATISYPTSAAALAGGPGGSGALSSTDAAAPAGDINLVPSGAYIEPDTGLLYLLLYNAPIFTLAGNSTSTHGQGAEDMYVEALSLATGNQVWAVRLPECVFADKYLSGYYFTDGLVDDPLVVTRVGNARHLVTSCLTSRMPADPADITAGAGSMLTYDVPLDATGQPVVAAMNAHIGRPNAKGGIADPTTGRLFIAAQPNAAQNTGANGSGPSAVVYDIAHQAYVGAPTLGGVDQVSGGFGMAAADGRFYAVGLDGVTVVNAGATPPGQGLLSRTYSCTVGFTIADPASRRLFVRPFTGCSLSGGNPAGHLDVLLDQYPSVGSQTPPDPDSFTTQVAERPGVTQSQFAGHAEATGARVRLIGGESGLVDGASLGGYTIALADTSQSDAIQDNGTRELDLAVVPSTDLGNYQAQATTIAARADDNTATDLQQKTGASWPFKEVACSDPGTSTAQQSYAGDTSSQSTCRLGDSASASSQAESLGLALSVAGQSSPSLVDLGRAAASTEVQLTAEGIVSDARSVVTGIDLGVVRIDVVSSESRCVAHGRTATARCSFTRLLNGVSINGSRPQGCEQVASPTGGSNGCEGLLAQLNALDPGYLDFLLPMPDARRGFASGSPGGYQAIAQRELYEHLQDSVVNYDDSTEVPGLELLYIQDSQTMPSRLDVQLGTVEAESHYGITLASPGCADCAGGSAPPLPGLPAAPAAHVGAAGPAASGVPGIVRIIARVWDGLKVLLRSPAAAAAASALLLMLVSPLLMGMRRRRLELLVKEVPS